MTSTTIDIDTSTRDMLRIRKKYWKLKSYSETIDYLDKIAGSFEEGGMEYEFDEKGKAI